MGYMIDEERKREQKREADIETERDRDYNRCFGFIACDVHTPLKCY